MLQSADRSISEAAKELAAFGVEATYLVPTKTGLSKSIIDAIAPFRGYLDREGIHDFCVQAQGLTHKRILRARFIHADGLTHTSVSLYRPGTKQGDPRVCFYGLSKYARAGNVLVVIALNGELIVANASSPEVWTSLADDTSPLRAVLREKADAGATVANELLQSLKRIASKGFIPTVRAGDTGVGATLEHALGIQTNSSKAPDYKGIEIKASRRLPTGGARNRVSLFSQVPDWSASRYKNGTQLLKAHGYVRDGRRQLYCTVGRDPNSQGLYHSVDLSAGNLVNLCSRDGVSEDVCVWPLELLRDRLGQKHHETFWVKARARGAGRGEEFHFVEAEHTRLPLLGNLEPMLAAGQITFDYTLSARPKGGVRDHGYLFKVWPQDASMLFPRPKTYSLV